MSALTDSPAWGELLQHKKIIESQHMRDLFADNAERFEDFCLQAGPVVKHDSQRMV